MKTEKEQLLKRTSKGNCGVFVVESEDRLKKWRLALAQRYSQANVMNRNIQIKWKGDVDDPVIKIKHHPLYKNNRKLMIQGKYLAKWTATEFAGLIDLVDGKSYDEVEWNNEWYQNQEQNKEIKDTPDADVNELQHQTNKESEFSKIPKLINSKLPKPRKPPNHGLIEGEHDQDKGHLLALEKLGEKYLAMADENKGLKKEVEKLKNGIVDIERKYKKLIEANKKEKQNLERITENEEKLKESVCSAQLPAEQEEIIQRIKGDQLINTEEIKKSKELINKVRIELETKQEKLLSSSDEFHGKKLENIKSDFQKEIIITIKDQIKEAVNEAFQGKKMMDLVNDCVLNLNKMIQQVTLAVLMKVRIFVRKIVR